MHLKTEIKKVIGKIFSIDFFEKLTEYSIWRNAEGFSLSDARVVTTPGKTWSDVCERGREKLWDLAIREINKSDILFLEFGVWKGYSIEFFSKLIISEDSRFYGFDSFEGLPEYWRGRNAGEFSTGGVIPNINDSRVKFIKGWFQASIPMHLDEIGRQSIGRAVLVHFDADLYSSTLFLLYTLTYKIREFYFIFDEFTGHESRALYNFIQSSGAKVNFFLYTEWKDLPGAVFGHLALADE